MDFEHSGDEMSKFACGISRIALAIFAGLVLNACSLSAPDTVRLSVQIPGESVNSSARLSNPFDAFKLQNSSSIGTLATTNPLPPTLNDFNCYWINVMGSGIAASEEHWNNDDLQRAVPLAIAGDQCSSYPGVRSQFVPVSTGGTVDLMVPSGANRIVQVLGMTTSTGSCADFSMASFDAVCHPNSQGGGGPGVDPCWTTFPNLVELGRSVVNLFQEKSVEIDGSSYNSATAMDVRCDKGPTGGSSYSYFYKYSFTPPLYYNQCMTVQLNAYQPDGVTPTTVDPVSGDRVTFSCTGCTVYSDPSCSSTLGDIGIPAGTGSSPVFYVKPTSASITLSGTTSHGIVDVKPAVTSASFSGIDWNYVSGVTGQLNDTGYMLGSNLNSSGIVIAKTTGGNYSVIQITGYTANSNVMLLYRTYAPGGALVVNSTPVTLNYPDAVIDLDLSSGNVCAPNCSTGSIYTTTGDLIYNSLNYFNSWLGMAGGSMFYKVP
jgi:hypothetical protein